MKKEIIFNHDAEKINEALQLTQDINKETKDVIIKFMMDDRTRSSVLSELIHNQMDYNTILALATQEVLGKIEEAFGEETLIKAIKTLTSILGEAEPKEDDIRASQN
jgi:hypothetical protein